MRKEAHVDRDRRPNVHSYANVLGIMQAGRRLCDRLSTRLVADLARLIVAVKKHQLKSGAADDGRKGRHLCLRSIAGTNMHHSLT